MPDIAATTAQPIAQFLAIGAPVAGDSAVSGDFAALLALTPAPQQTTAPLQTGKILPAMRQDLAALPPIALPVAVPTLPAEAELAANLDVSDEPAAEAPVAAPIISVLALLPRQENARIAPVLPRPVRDAGIEPRIVPLEVEAAAPADVVPVETIVIEVPVKAAPAKAETEETVSEDAPVVETAPIVVATPVLLPDPVMRPALQAEPVAAIETVTASPVEPVAQAIAAPVTAAAPAVKIAAAPAPAPQAPAVEATVRQAPEAIQQKADKGAAAEAPAPVRHAPQPVAEARSVSFVMRADPALAETAPVKRPRSTAADLIANGDMAGLFAAAPADVRVVTATGTAQQITPLPEQRATALIETIETLRAEARGDSVSLEISHADFGPMTVDFDHQDDGVTIRFDTIDSDVAKLIADATPELKAAGEPLGMRFERRDSAANAGTSQDTPRQGHNARQDDTVNHNRRQQPRTAQGRGGIFA